MSRILRRVRPEPGRVRNFGPDSGAYRIEQEKRIAKERLRVHVEESRKAGKNVCPDCGNIFATAFGLRRHRGGRCKGLDGAIAS